MKTRAAYLLALLASLLTACDSAPRLPVDRPNPEPFQALEVKAQVEVGAGPAFADQTGGGIFATAEGDVVRLRLDGTRAPLESHPGNEVAPGWARAVFRLGAGAALVEADNGLFLAESGWLLAPPWRDALAPGLTATAATPDGTVWLGHVAGLYRLRDGVLSALKVEGQALDGVTGLAAAPAEDGAPGLWLLRREALWVAVRTAPGTYQVRPAEVPLKEEERLVSLVGLGASAAGPAEVWLLTSERLLRRSADGWRQVALAWQPEQMLAAGRFLWMKAGDALLTHDAEAGTWGEVKGMEAQAFHLLAVDESGCAWVRRGAKTVALTRGPVPRVLGLHEGLEVVEDVLVVRARLAPGGEPVRLTFELAGVQVPVQGPSYSLGGEESDGTPRPYSLVGLEAGWHTLSAVAHYPDGTEGRRAVSFTYQPLSTVALGWEQDIRPIHEARCAKCHVSGPGRPLSTHALWKENAELIVAAVREQRMPADGPLDPQLISLIQRWAATGANP